MSVKIYPSYTILFLLLLFAACAQVRNIPGGEKDVVAPVALYADPPQLSTNIKPTLITIGFDEYVQLNSIQQELVVSPPLNRQPKFKIKKRELQITIEENLRDNTTYLFNFGDGIVDVNENNKAQDLIYVFSTGPEIDSLELSGNAIDVSADAPAKGLKVLLFNNDTAVFTKKSLPSYFAKTKEDGTFKLAYLHEGTYYMYAIDDVNGNYTWDEGESIGTGNNPVVISANDSINVEFEVSKPRLTKPVVETYFTDSIGRVSFVLDKYYHDLTITSLSGNEVYRTTHEDTIKAWIIGSPVNGNTQLHINWNNQLSDTISLPWFDEAQKRSVELFVEAGKKIKSTDTLFIHANAPVKWKDQNFIQLSSDSIPQTFKVDTTNSKNILAIIPSVAKGKNASLRIMPGAIENQSGAVNDTLRFDFSILKNEELGQLQFNVSGMGEQENFVFELYDKYNRIVFRKKNCRDETLLINDLPAGEYFAKLLRDDNGNIQFDPSIPKKNQGPERIYNFPGKINVRSNWEVKLEWKMDPDKIK